jgi:hypothetical protein
MLPYYAYIEYTLKRDEKAERVSALGLVLDCGLSFSQGGKPC